METREYSNATFEARDRQNLGDMLKNLEEKCRKCTPLTPIVCMTECRTWRLKNQLRKINEKMQKPDFMAYLLNTLKNKRRLHILNLISRQHYSASQLQHKLRSLGFNHSQQTIVEEYINPLLEAGLVQEDQNPYELTIFGNRLNELLKDFQDLEDLLPPHSECYEETVLNALMYGSKTYEDLRAVIPAKSVARVLSRLQRAALVQTSMEKNYIFFFRTKRDPSLSHLSPTETRVYQAIPDEGISAGKLAQKGGISLRRTYKYLRKLKGRKLVFTRKKPLSYSLTARGTEVADMLNALKKLTAEAQQTSEQLLNHQKEAETAAPTITNPQ